jgi:hypothetical protein
VSGGVSHTRGDDGFSPWVHVWGPRRRHFRLPPRMLPRHTPHVQSATQPLRAVPRVYDRVIHTGWRRQTATRGPKVHLGRRCRNGFARLAAIAAVTLLVVFAWRSLVVTPPLGRGRRQEAPPAVEAASRNRSSSLVTPPGGVRQDDAPWARRLPDGVHAEYHVVHGDSTVAFINAVAATRWADPCPCAVIVTTLASTAAHVPLYHDRA